MPKMPKNTTRTTFFNEINSYAAQWLRNLFPQSVVEEKSIVGLRRSDVVSYDRVHLFAGIGGWEYALRLAKFPEREREYGPGRVRVNRSA